MPVPEKEIYEDQRVKFWLNTFTDLSLATNAQVLYERMDTNEEGSWPGTVSGKYITYHTVVGDLKAGRIALQPYYEVDGQKYYGGKRFYTVLKPITP